MTEAGAMRGWAMAVAVETTGTRPKVSAAALASLEAARSSGRS